MTSTWMKGWILGIMLLPGCALLSPDLSDEEKYADDPVARAALALRSSSASVGDASASDDLRSGRNLASRPDFDEYSLQQLTLGMSTSRVRSLWGQPQEIENAGDPTQGNQRWIYLNGLKRNWGTSDYRVVYFERNQVVGWENHR
jgi:hypothetical protein